MVVFTCAHCGESVKKNQVEKHHTNTRCRNVFPSLTCVDCLEDFNGDEYAAHTSCVTEAERYSAKGFVSKTPSNKGKKRQENWLQFIRRILDSSVCLDGQVKNLLERIAPDPGVPQKKAKFLNFCKNKFRHFYNQTVYERTWEFLEKMRAEMRNSSASENVSQNNEESPGDQEDRKRKRIDSSNDNSTDNSENKTNDRSKCNNETSGKKKKKQKQDIDSVESCVVQEKSGEAVSKKKIKSKSQNSCVQNGDVSVADEENEDQDNCIEIKGEDEAQAVQDTDDRGNEEREQADRLSKKKKKENRKKEKYERQLLEILNQPDEEQQVNNNVNTEVLEKRKKKKKRQENGAIENLEQEAVKTDSKKKRVLLDADVSTVENGDGKEEHVDEQIDVKPSKFNWEETVVKLLESKGELPLKRVEKKIVNEYMNSGAHVDSIEKVIAKFNKKIVKMLRVKVKKDVVRLVS